MAVKRTVTKPRPSTGVDFEVLDSSVINHITTNYINTGKQTAYNKSLSGDQLTLTVERTFANSTAKDEFEADSAFKTAAKTKRNTMTGNGISVSKSITEV